MRGRAIAWLWGIVLSCWILHFFFTFPPGVFHRNHEGASYAYRVIEFRSLLEAGYPFPQWAVHFRGGLGSPYFGYYQPNFFYVASLLSLAMPVVPAIGATLIAFALLGYGGMVGLIGTRFGTPAGVLAGTALVLSSYALRDVYVRGDLSEYCGMMLLAALVSWLVGWLERGRRATWLALALGCAVLVPLHPAVALFGYGTLGIVLVWYGVATRAWSRALWPGGALVAGAMVAAFYWLSVLLEWDFVHGDAALAEPFQYFRHFLEPGQLLGLPGRRTLVRADLGVAFLSLVGSSTLLLVVARRTVTPSQWRLVGMLWLLVAVAVFLMTHASEPVWAAVPLLQRLQFPWRLLVVLSIAGAGLAGATPVLGRALMVVGIASLGVSFLARQPTLTDRYAFFATADEITTRFAHPDVMNEWLPRGAMPMNPFRHPFYRHPRCANDCSVTGFARTPGRLSFGVEGTAGTKTVTLPHYAFPVGWTARIVGRGAPRKFLPPSRVGLMRIAVPAGAHVELTFTTTPARRVGAMVSAVSLALLLLAWRWAS